MVSTGVGNGALPYGITQTEWRANLASQNNLRSRVRARKGGFGGELGTPQGDLDVSCLSMALHAANESLRKWPLESGD